MAELNWTYDEFICFVMIYVSNSDMDFSENEKSKIIKSFGEEVFEKQFKVFDDLNDFQALNAILDYKKKYFGTEDEKVAVLEKIKNQFFLDGYSEYEREVYMFLEKLL